MDGLYKTRGECWLTTHPNKKGSLRLPFTWRIELHAVFLAELLDTASSVNNLLLACIERMTLGANFDVHVLARGGACLELVAATASHVDFSVVRMDLGLHAGISFKAVAGNA